MKTTCFARILDKPFTIEGTVCHTTTECGRDGFKKITIDDGDAYFMICSDCFRRFLTKGSRNSTWYGWFDCDIPPDARVKGSVWWRETSLAAKKDKEVKEVLEEIDEILSQASSQESVEPPPKPTSKKEMLEKRLAELQLYVKLNTKNANQEFIKAHRELIKIKAELKMFK